MHGDPCTCENRHEAAPNDVPYRSAVAQVVACGHRTIVHLKGEGVENRPREGSAKEVLSYLGYCNQNDSRARYVLDSAYFCPNFGQYLGKGLLYMTYIFSDFLCGRIACRAMTETTSLPDRVCPGNCNFGHAMSRSLRTNFLVSDSQHGRHDGEASLM
jgi:hypothetical protein